jgi:Domain found in Dishevelled, Egl-10, and Pleckstrin (DEP)/Pyridine nucleotide-disulphide oxidoreductase
MAAHSNCLPSSLAQTDLSTLASTLRQIIPVADRMHRLQTYRSVFVGTDAVDTLVNSGHATSRVDAVVLGNALADAGLIEHVTRDHGFKDDFFFYRFVPEDARGAVKRGTDGSPVRWADFLACGAGEDGGGDSARAGGLAPRLPVADFDAVPAGSVHVASLVWPMDRWNTELLDKVHPAEWVDPEAADVYNVVIIGAGAGGLVSAAGAAGVGAKVALVEANLLGGDCLNVGCVPSKALIHAANMAHACRDTERLAAVGITVAPGAVTVDFAKTMERLRRVRANIADADSAARFTTKLGVGSSVHHEDLRLGVQAFHS